jgi:type I restriction-modification system DNA methylase subunit
MYLAEAKRWNREQLDLFCQAFAGLVLESETRPYQDLLGDIHMETLSTKGKQQTGEFYTPQPVCTLMARMLLEDNSEPVMLHEPCAGSGRLVLACAQTYAEIFNRSPTLLRVEAWDLSRTAVMMTFINTTLWGIPCTTVHGNTITLEHFAVYPNMFSLLYPFPKVARKSKGKEEESNTNKEKQPKVINLGRGHEQFGLFDLDKAA